jgi:hypothetical protein
MKVVKSYSLEVETAQLLESYHVDSYGEIGNRSKTVNDAIVWYLNNEALQEVLETQKLVNDALRDEINRLRKPSLLRRILSRMRVKQ